MPYPARGSRGALLLCQHLNIDSEENICSYVIAPWPSKTAITKAVKKSVRAGAASDRLAGAPGHDDCAALGNGLPLNGREHVDGY